MGDILTNSAIRILILYIISIACKIIINQIVLHCCAIRVCKNISGEFYQKHILKVNLFGFIADAVGFASMTSLFAIIFNAAYLTESIAYALLFSFGFARYLDVSAFLVYLICGVIVSAFLIYILDYFFIFKKSGFNKKQNILCSLAFSVFTAPYVFIFPMEILIF